MDEWEDTYLGIDGWKVYEISFWACFPSNHFMVVPVIPFQNSCGTCKLSKVGPPALEQSHVSHMNQNAVSKGYTEMELCTKYMTNGPSHISETGWY